MFRPNPIDEDFVPYTQRLVLANNADLFVDRGQGGGVAHVAPQQGYFTPGECRRPGQRCGAGLTGVCDEYLECVAPRR